MNFRFTILFCFLTFFANAQNQYYVLFDYDKAIVPDSAMTHLIKTIYTYNITEIYLEGHCDSIGSKKYNYGLSKRRVQAVEQLLIDNGFLKPKIHGKIGFGKDKPLTANNSAEARQKNRRVLVKFVTDKSKEPSVLNDFNKTSITTKTTGKIATPKKVRSNISITSKDKKNIKQVTPATRAKNLDRKNFTANSKIALPNLLFQGGRHYLINQSTASLDTLIKILKERPTLRIEIQGHVCCTTYELDGFDWDTKTDNLSVNRALAIKDYLVKSGISSTRLKTKGFGGSQKIFPIEDNRYQRGQNRRVEVMVLSE